MSVDTSLSRVDLSNLRKFAPPRRQSDPPTYLKPPRPPSSNPCFLSPLLLRHPCKMESRSRTLTRDNVGLRSRSVSPHGTERGRMLSDVPQPLCVSHSFTPGSERSSPCASRKSSMCSNSDLISAIDALTAQCERDAASLSTFPLKNGDRDLLKQTANTDNPQCNGSEREGGGGGGGREDPQFSTSLHSRLAANDQLLQKCKKEIQKLNKSTTILRREKNELCSRLLEARAITRSKGLPRRWPAFQGAVSEFHKKFSYDEVLIEPSEIISAFLESEWHYLNNLNLLNTYFEQPMRMLTAFKPEVLSPQQLNSLFLNNSELLLLHRFLYESLRQVFSLPESIQVDQLFTIFENFFPSLSVYTSFFDTTRPQHIQRELKVLAQRPQFLVLLNQCQKNCDDITLQELLAVQAERLNEYSNMLTYFLDPRVRGLPDNASRRAEALIRFLRNTRYELYDQKSEWDHTQEKIKVLHKLHPDGPIPLEIFDSNVKVVKQGPLNLVMGKKEVQRFCFLFNNYIAVAERATDAHFKVSEHGMIPLSGAQLHRCVDVEGQAISADLQSGLKEDKLAFRLSFLSNESLFFRVAKPNEWRAWVDTLEKCIQESQFTQQPEAVDHAWSNHSDVQPKIAAASLEKLFQQLTSPHIREDFMEVFLLTHSCFTTPKEVLTALLNCLKTPEDNMSDTSSQSSGVFLFNMEELTEPSPSVSTSTSLYNITTSDSESNSPSTSPAVYRRSISAAADVMPTINSASSSPRVIPRSNALEPGSMRKKQPAARGSYSTTSTASDSDISPHTSAVNPLPDDDLHSNGWMDPETALKLPPQQIGIKISSNEDHLIIRESKISSGDDNMTIVGDGKLSLSPGGHLMQSDIEDHYSKLVPRTAVHLSGCHSSEESGEEEAEEGGSNGGETPKASLTHTGRQRSLSGSDIPDALGNEEDTLKEKLENLHPSQKMNLELDETSKMLQQLTESLADFDTPPPIPANCHPNRLDSKSGGYGETDGFNEEETLRKFGTEVRRRRSRTLSDRALRDAVVSASLSEPDLTIVGIETGEASDKGTTSKSEFKRDEPVRELPLPGKIVRRNSEHSLLTGSTNVGSESPFLHGKAMMGSPSPKMGGSPAHHHHQTPSPAHRRASNSISTDHTGSPNGKEPKGKSKSKKSRKADTIGSSPARQKLSSASFTKSSTYTRNGSVHEIGTSPNRRSSKWQTLKKKIGIKGSNRSPSMEPDDFCSLQEQTCPNPNQPKRSRTFLRKHSLSTEISRSISMTDGMSVSPAAVRQRRGSSSTAQCNVNLIPKIFGVLACWQENFFEDFAGDAELKRDLEEFLYGLISRTTQEGLECQFARKLLNEIGKQESVSRAPTGSFPELLSRVTNIDMEVLNTYNWDNRKELMKGNQLDLSKQPAKDSPLLITLAEQLTLMEFAVYAAVERRELLNCNWKKKDKEAMAPNLWRLIRRTNAMTSWVCTEILTRETPALRASVIENFIQIAEHCFNHHDMHCALNITIALGSSCIKTLAKTWDEVEKKYRQRFEKLRDQTDYHGRCKKMRERLESITEEAIQKTDKLPNALPYIGAYLDQIYTLDMNAKTYNPDGLVNFAKMTKLFVIIMSVLQYQKSCFPFVPRLELIAYVTAADRLPENDLFELSMKREPSS